MIYQNFLFLDLHKKTPNKISELYLDNKPVSGPIRPSTLLDANKPLCYLYNVVYNKLTCIVNKIYYEFIVDFDANPKVICNSYNLASGVSSSSIILICLSHKLPFKLIFKVTKIRKRDKYSHRTYDLLYNKSKYIFGNSLCDCYFYGYNLIPRFVQVNKDMTEEYKLSKTEDITYGIYRFYNEQIITLGEKINIIFKLVSFLIFLQMKGYWLYDFSIVNIKFDKIFGELILVLIDFDYKLFSKYKTVHNKETFIQIFDEITTSPWFSCCLKKQLAILLGLLDDLFVKEIYEKADKMEEQIIKDKVYRDKDQVFRDKFYKFKLVYPLLMQRFREVTQPNIRIEGKHSYFLTKYPIYFDKFNYFTLIDLIIHLFFKINGTHADGTSYKYNFDQLLYGETIGVSKFKLHKFTKAVERGTRSLIDHFRATQNLNDLRILKCLLYGTFERDVYINPVFEKNDDVDKELSDIINFLLFDNVSECGIFAPDYENIANLYLILKFIQNKFKLGTNLFESHKHNLDLNIGTDEILTTTVEDYERLFNDSFKITNIGQDVIDFFIRNKILSGIPNINNLSYDKWSLLRLVEQLLDRPDNRTIENLENPPKNSTLPQNYYIYIDESGKKQIVTKWKKNSQPTVAQPTVAQPTVTQPTVAQPTVAQPTVAQPTVAQPISQSKESSINSSVRKKLELKPRTIQSSSTVAQPTTDKPTTDKPRRTLEMLDKEWNLEKDEHLTEDMPDFEELITQQQSPIGLYYDKISGKKEKIDIQPFSPLNVGQLYDKTAEYMEVLKGIQSSKYREYITPEQQFLNKTPMRLYAILLAYHIKNGLSLNIQTEKPETIFTTEKPKSISTTEKPETKSTTEKPKPISTIKKPISTPKDTGIDPDAIYGHTSQALGNPIVAYKYFKYKDKYLKLKNQLNN